MSRGLQNFQTSLQETFDKGKQLGQSRPSGTTAVSIYSPPASVTGNILTIFICNNTSGTAADYTLYHDNDGATYDETTMIHPPVNLNPGEVIEVNTWIPMDDSSGNLAVKTSVANAITFTVYGVEAT